MVAPAMITHNQDRDQDHGRARSFSDGDRTTRPPPPKFIFDASSSHGSRRAAMPRAASTVDMHRAAAAAMADDPEHAFRDIAREQIDREALRDLVQFLRTTGPPPTAQNGPPENCFGKAAPADNKRWSMRSLRRAPKDRRPASAHARQSHDSAVLRTTAAGHSYRAISVPPGSDGDAAAHPPLRRHRSVQHASRVSPLSSNPVYARYSAGGAQPPASIDSSPQRQARPDRSSRASDLAAVVSRSSSLIDKNPYRLSVRVSTAEPGVRSFLKLVDEWLDDQSSDADSRRRSQESRAPSLAPISIQRAQTSTATLSPVLSEPGDEEQDMSNPKIELNPPPLSPSTSLKPTPETESGFPATPPHVGVGAGLHGGAYPEIRRDMPESSFTDTPRSLESKNRPPIILPPRKDSLRYASTGESPKSKKHHKAPSSLSARRGLQVPDTSKLPESPGFPAMLATMAFPSPPESVHSHSPSNSVASPPQATGWPSAGASPPRSDLNQRVMQPALNSTAAPSTGTSDSDSLELPIPSRVSSRRAEGEAPFAGGTPRKDSATAPPSSMPGQRVSQDSPGPYEADPHRDSLPSTLDSTRQSATMSERRRHSLRSDTSATSDMTATTEAYAKSQPFRPSESKRSSVVSASSASTSGTATSLAERRMARRARVREKLQRDLEASKSNLSANRPGPADESVDSPVLGWFPQVGPGAPHLPRKASAGPSPLALAHRSQDPRVAVDASDRSGHASRRSSVQGAITPLIPETVQETTSPTTPTAPRPSRCTLSPIVAEETEPDPGSAEAMPAPAVLTMSPIMVVASIEARSPSASLRPLSLLTANGASPPSVPPRSTLRPDSKAGGNRQRPLPVRVSKNPLDLTVNTSNLNLKRYSSPSIATAALPVSPESPTSPRRSLPMERTDPNSAPASYADHSPGGRAGRGRQVQSMVDKETRWLTEHQRQSAEEWRTAALRERMRRNRLENRATPFPDAIDAPVREEDAEDEDKTADGEEESGNPREEHRRSTLRMLDSNRNSDVDAVERRLLNAILPLLESMNSTLREMKMDTANRELSTKFMDSAMAIATSPLLERGPSSAASTGERRASAVEAATPSPVVATNE